MSTMNSAFAEALAKKKQAEKEAEEAKNRKGGFDYEDDREYCDLKYETDVVFRICGFPIDSKDPEGSRKPSDPKLILQSKIVSEKKKGYVNINWPFVYSDGKIKPDPKWILTRLYEKVNEREWVKYTESDVDGENVFKENGKIVNGKGYNGKWFFHYAHTTIYGLLNDCNKAEWDKFGQYVYPSKRVVMNVIDRMNDWCKNNSHSKILISNLSVSEKEDPNTKEKIIRYFPDTGISYTLYEDIFLNFIECGSDWFGLDAVVKKTKRNNKTVYKVYDATDKKISDFAKSVAVEGPLTEEESSYVLFDLDKYYSVTSYNKLLKRLKHIFQLCDAEIGTHFLEELEDLANMEAEERKNQESDEDPEEIDNKEEEFKEAEKVESSKEAEKKSVSRERRSFEQKSKEESFDVVKYFSEYFSKWNELPQTDKDILIKEFKSISDSGIPEFGEPATCTESNCVFPGTDIPTETPNTLSMCPVCGVVYPEQ